MDSGIPPGVGVGGGRGEGGQGSVGLGHGCIADYGVPGGLNSEIRSFRRDGRFPHSGCMEGIRSKKNHPDELNDSGFQQNGRI